MTSVCHLKQFLEKTLLEVTDHFTLTSAYGKGEVVLKQLKTECDWVYMGLHQVLNVCVSFMFLQDSRV